MSLKLVEKLQYFIIIFFNITVLYRNKILLVDFTEPHQVSLSIVQHKNQ